MQPTTNLRAYLLILTCPSVTSIQAKVYLVYRILYKGSLLRGRQTPPATLAPGIQHNKCEKRQE